MTGFAIRSSISAQFADMASAAGRDPFDTDTVSSGILEETLGTSTMISSVGIGFTLQDLDTHFNLGDVDA